MGSLRRVRGAWFDKGLFESNVTHSGTGQGWDGSTWFPKAGRFFVKVRVPSRRGWPPRATHEF